MRRIDLEWFTLDWAKRWLPAICVAALGVGSITGAVWYRAAVPTITQEKLIPQVVTQTVTPAPQFAVETRTAVSTVTVTADRPPPVTQAAVTITKTAEAPEPEVVIKKNVETTTVTETVTNPADAVLNVGRRGNRENGEGR